MDRVGSFRCFAIGCLALVAMPLALGACSSRVVSGDENSVVIDAGPTDSISDVEEAAHSYCARYGKQASIEGGGELGSETLEETYRFDCVDQP